MGIFTKNDTDMMIHAVAILFNETGDFVNKYQNKYLPGSRAKKEIQAFTNSSTVETVFSQSSFMIEVAGDHLSAFARILTEPIHSIAPWTCARVVLESSTIALWLLALDIDEKERVKRSFAFRYDGLNEQLKIARSQGSHEDIKNVTKRIDEVENEALALGYPRVLSTKNPKRIGIGKQMPARTTLVEMILGDTAPYRLLSAQVHAHPWALQQMSFRQPSSDVTNYFEKHLDFDLIAYLCQINVTSFSKALWYKTLLFGWDDKYLENIFKSVFDQLRIPPKNRFWIES